jgi:hypothetical protein
MEASVCPATVAVTSACQVLKIRRQLNAMFKKSQQIQESYSGSHSSRNNILFSSGVGSSYKAWFFWKSKWWGKFS